MKDLLPIMSANKSIQRLVVKYKEALDQISKKEAEMSQARAGSNKGSNGTLLSDLARRSDAALNSAFNREQRVRDPGQLSPTKRITPVTPLADDNANNNTENNDKDVSINESQSGPVEKSSTSAEEKRDGVPNPEEKMEEN